MNEYEWLMDLLIAVLGLAIGIYVLCHLEAGTVKIQDPALQGLLLIGSFSLLIMGVHYAGRVIQHWWRK